MKFRRKVTGGDVSSSHLEAALHILQDVNSTVAEVILLRHTWAGALHQILPETPLSPFTHLPLHLQVPKTNTHSVSVTSTAAAFPQLKRKLLVLLNSSIMM